MSKRSERQRADKYKQRAAAMLDRYHWQKDETLFLGLMETGDLTMTEVRELTWTRIKNTYEGLNILEKPIVLRSEHLEEFREMLKNETGVYGESISGKEAVNLVFKKESMKNICRELDQFKDV